MSKKTLVFLGAVAMFAGGCVTPCDVLSCCFYSLAAEPPPEGPTAEVTPALQAVSAAVAH
jgi:hypothetical protein